MTGADVWSRVVIEGLEDLVKDGPLVDLMLSQLGEHYLPERASLGQLAGF
jgi:hypothetical protein